jgi:leucyl-tRNA synthetase
MAERYNHQEIEQKWQQAWEAANIYRATVDWSKPKHYALTMLPYPSGDLHIGHWFAMTPSDARARYMRMKGYNVLFPMGFDAFGLPAENAAVQRGIHPATWTYENIKRMRGQLKSMGAMFDWEREIVSCEPEYYRWTEWFFKQFYQGELAYRGEAMVNWSPTLQTVLANEQVIDGKDERTDQPVIQKKMTQWFFQYTAYRDEMLTFPDLDYPESTKAAQINWIGRSEGANVTFKTEHGNDLLIYTTRPDTLWGATFMVLSPEHPLVSKLTTPAQKAEVEAYVTQAARRTELDRMSDDREKTGVFTGGYAINPVNQERIPVYVADYVLMSYGSGAIMAVPAHDERDFAFARKYGINVRVVVQPQDAEPLDGATMAEAYAGSGVIAASGPINDQISNGEKGRRNPAIAAAINWLHMNKVGEEAKTYRLRDWLISRQRYWGSPIPIIHKADGTLEVADDGDLPVELPTDVAMTGTGNPLQQHASFAHVTDSNGQPAMRETDTMDTFMCSSWYWYRYLSPRYAKGPFDPEEAAYWLPVDTYTGGTEHATMHLLYARWFSMAMRDNGMFDEAVKIAAAHGRNMPNLGEPWAQLRHQGQILGEPRIGDFVLATGRFEDEKLFADTVEVTAPSGPKLPEPMPQVGVGANSVAGEIIKRTENIMTVDVGNKQLRTVEIVPTAQINIPDIPGPNTVAQLKQHLEVERMSKSRGNVVNPDELVAQYGADAVRSYLMFAFEWSQGGPWNSNQVIGVVRWLNEVWDMVLAGPPSAVPNTEAEAIVERRVHQTIGRIEKAMLHFTFNSAIAALMELKNELRTQFKVGVSAECWRAAVRDMLLMMAPFTPHIAEELWARTGFANAVGTVSIHQQTFPLYDDAKAAETQVTLVVQIGAKVVDRIPVAPTINEAEAFAAVQNSSTVQYALRGNSIKKMIFVPGRATPGRAPEPKVNIVIG